jgi:hypothetical protein
MRREILRLQTMIAGAKIDLEELYDQKKEWDDKFGAGDDIAPLSRDFSKADKKEDRDTRKEILRLEGVVAGARIDLDELYDRKREWDHKLGPGNDTAHSSRTIRPESTPRLSVAVSAGPSLPRPTPPIVPIVDDDNDELDEDKGQGDQVETEERERQRLVRLFYRPGHENSLIADSIGALRIMENTFKAHPRLFKP